MEDGTIKVAHKIGCGFCADVKFVGGASLSVWLFMGWCFVLSSLDMLVGRC